MLPNLKRIDIYRKYYISNYDFDGLGDIMSKMVGSLVDGIEEVGYRDTMDSVEDFTFDPDAFSGLTSFYYVFGNFDEQALEVILRNSSTLQQIGVSEMPCEFIGRMLYRENGDPVVYGCTRALELDILCVGMEPNIKDYTCHFPCLKKLVVSESDPVLINVLFNGADKLEDLHLYTEYEDVDGINDRQMFKLCQLQNLKHLELGYTTNRDHDAPRDDPNKVAQYSKFVENLINRPRCLQSFSLTSFWHEQKLLDIITSTAAFANIQKLKFDMRGMQFNVLVSVIRNCPQLQVLIFPIVNDFPSIDGMRDEELVRHFETELYPLSRYLTSMHVEYGWSYRKQETYLAIALLVVGCPRLSKIHLPYSFYSKVREGIRLCSETSMFSKYRDRLENIVPSY